MSDDTAIVQNRLYLIYKCLMILRLNRCLAMPYLGLTIEFVKLNHLINAKQ